MSHYKLQIKTDVCFANFEQIDDNLKVRLNIQFYNYGSYKRAYLGLVN